MQQLGLSVHPYVYRVVAINTAVEELVHLMSDLSAAGCTTVQYSVIQ